MTHFLALRDVRRARAVYADVLGGRVGTGENPCIVRLANGWVIMNSGGGPTSDKPDVELVPYEASSRVSSFMNLWLADIEASYREWLVRRAHFLTVPLDRDPEIRCCMRDPDGFLIEVGQAAGLVEGRLAEEAPAGGEAAGTNGQRATPPRSEPDAWTGTFGLLPANHGQKSSGPVPANVAPKLRNT